MIRWGPRIHEKIEKVRERDRERGERIGEGWFKHLSPTIYPSPYGEEQCKINKE
jgi:hypothetical protein